MVCLFQPTCLFNIYLGGFTYYEEKILALFLTATMIVSTSITAMADYTYNGVTLVAKNGATIVADPDDSTNKVASINMGYSEAQSTFGSDYDYFTTGEGALSSYSFTDGVAVEFRVRPTEQHTDWNYIFGLGINGDDTTTSLSWNYVDGTIGWTMRYGDTYNAFYPGTQSSTYTWDYFITGSATASTVCNKWYTLKYVYTTSGLSIYVDGTLVFSHDLDATQSSALATVLSNLNQGSLNIGCGISPTFEHFQGYIDDFTVYSISGTNETEVISFDFEEHAETATNASASSDSTTTTTTATATGDESMTVVMIALALVAIGATVVVKRKKVTE